jgi:membrane-associated phospholipid phosphatase
VAPWALAAAAYGALLTGAALTQPIHRRALAAAAAAAFALLALAAGTRPDSFSTQLLAPGALLLAGYWLSGLYFRDPQPWLESWLLRVDRHLGADTIRARLPRAVNEMLELAYAGAYLLVAGGALYAATAGLEAVEHYWTLVLTSELASFAPLPWLRSRPPRTLEAAPPVSVALRRLNLAITNNASIQANTLPSGHVAGAVAAALGVMAFDPLAGAWLMVLAVVIALAAVAGRYHYVVDCVAGAVVAAGVWLL